MLNLNWEGFDKAAFDCALAFRANRRAMQGPQWARRAYALWSVQNPHILGSRRVLFRPLYTVTCIRRSLSRVEHHTCALGMARKFEPCRARCSPLLSPTLNGFASAPLLLSRLLSEPRMVAPVNDPLPSLPFQLSQRPTTHARTYPPTETNPPSKISSYFPFYAVLQWARSASPGSPARAHTDDERIAAHAAAESRPGAHAKSSQDVTMLSDGGTTVRNATAWLALLGRGCTLRCM